jgi:hypothetical protein
MDRITLQQYEERAIAALNIVTKIEERLVEIEKAKIARNVTIVTKKGQDIRINLTNQTGELPNDSRTHLQALILNVFITNTLFEIRELEAELVAL